jgi:hypothetical protein
MGLDGGFITRSDFLVDGAATYSYGDIPEVRAQWTRPYQPVFVRVCARK